MLFLSLVYIISRMHSFDYILLSFHIIPWYLRMWVLCLGHTFLSHVVWVIVQVFHPSRCWVGLWFIVWVVVFHSSWCELTVVVLCCGLIKEWYGREGCNFHDLWLVLLDRFLGVDPREQSMLPRVRYGMTCLLISNTSGGSLARSMVREHLGYPMNQHGARGVYCGKL
jgi:hypothetical protein